MIADRLVVGNDEHDPKVSLAPAAASGAAGALVWICLLVIAGAGLCSALLA